ncbi:MAG: TonB-dependent receptor [Verrucomicrobia subdivision 3 bacterium]|nr:TonB-dependent receptor [Limisphaerales bacterium]
MSKNWLLLALIALGAGTLPAQQHATLTGIVTDSSAAVIPAAKVVLTHSETAETYAASTDASGNYTIPFIKPGTYTLAVESVGFKKYSRPSVRLDTAASARIDISLELGDVAESVVVNDEVPLLKTESSSVGNIVQNKTIANMPLINRRAAQLVRLSGFVVQRGEGSQFQIAGGRSDNAMWTLDGGSTQNILLGVASLNFDPPIEALEEMNVEVANYKAEMGRSGGGFIQMTTKSGTNQFHGALYEYLRNDALDSRHFFATDKQTLRRNQFGWALGGPIVRDRTFFFASQEFTRQTTANPRIENIPSLAERRGDFSGLTTIRDPSTGLAVPGNIIPASQIDPVGLKVAEFWPAPNVPGRPSRNQNYTANARYVDPNQTMTVRIDHTLSDRHRIFGRYAHSMGKRTEGADIWPNALHNDHWLIDGSYYNWSVTGVSAVRPNLVGEYRFTWNKRKYHPTMAAKGLGLAQQIGFQGGNPDFFPGFGFSGGIQRIARAGGQERRQFPIRDNHFATNWTYSRGVHTIKWGWEMRASRNDDENLPSAGGSLNFNNNATGDPVAALLYGWVASANREETFLIRSRANSMGAYIQDDWKLTPKLTLNLGLRYDLDTPRFEAIDNRQNSFDVAAINDVCNCPGILTWSGRGARDGSKYAHNFVYTNLGPRIGLAYRATADWVIRAGASIVYIGQYDQATPISATAGFSIQGSFGTLRPTDAAFRLRDGLPAIHVPAEADLVPGFGAVPIGTAPVFAPQFFQPEGRPNPYLITYNLNIQRQLPGDMLFEIGYLSTLGRKLTVPGSATLNQIHPSQIHLVDTQRVAPQVLRPFPQFSNVVMVAPTWGSSMYHGVNLKLEKRYSNGFQFSANYTFARALDDVEGRNELGGEDGNAPFADQYDRSTAWSLGGSHIKHRYITSVVWDLPVGRGRAHSFGSPVLNQIAGGWTVGSIIEARTGPPFSLYWGNASQIYPTAALVRADAVAPYQENHDWRQNVRGETFFDPSSFVRPARFTFGNVGRNAFIGPGALRADLSLIKHIFLPWESHSLQFRTEIINFPNRANFGLPNSNLQAGNVATITSLAPAASGRIIQLGLRYAF